MPFEILGDPGFHRELAALSATEQDKVRLGLRGLLDAPLEHPKLARLHGSAYPGSFRLRVGTLRVLGLVLASQRLILLTTVFRKKRDSDYDQALSRHEGRLAKQGPPLAEFLHSARRKR